MKKILCISAALMFVAATWIPSVSAGGYYYPSHHRNYYPHYSYSHRTHHHWHSNDVWLGLGLGVLTGAVIGSIAAAPPPPPPAVVYVPERRVVVQTQPVVQQIQVVPERIYPVERELVLRQVTTTPELLNVRSGPDMNSGVVGQVRKNQVLNVIGAAPDWLYIKTEDGYYGWVMTQYTLDAVQPVG